MGYEFTFTVFTPTFNRVAKLPRVYKSLLIQTFKDFEWIVVDDGSMDGTKELVEQWITEAKIPIHYLWQENRGKHNAKNRAIDDARGELFLTVDSDDEVLPTGLQLLVDYWRALPEMIQGRFAGVAGLCLNAEGRLMGDPFPADVFDSNMFAVPYRYGVRGGKFGFQRTDVMREFKFTGIEGETFVPEALLWTRIARKYKTRFINEPLYIYHKTSSGLAASWLDRLVKSPNGTALFYHECLSMNPALRFKVKALANYIRSCIHAERSVGRLESRGNLSKQTILLGRALGRLLYWRDRGLMLKRAYFQRR